MSCLGSHTVLTAEQRAQLEALPTGEDRYFYVMELHEELDDAFHQPTEKAWDAIHRCVTQLPPGEMLDSEAGSYPLNLTILGGRTLSDDPNFIVQLIEPHQLQDLAQALAGISNERFAELYWQHCRDYALEFGADDLSYCLDYFEQLRDFMGRIAPMGRSVVFTADQ
jgi:hypothetical protein